MARRQAADTVAKNLRRAQKREALLCESKLLFADDICKEILPQLLRDFRASGVLDIDLISERVAAYFPHFPAQPAAENEAAVSSLAAASNGIFAAECAYKLSSALENALRKKNFFKLAFAAGSIEEMKVIAMPGANTFSEIFALLQKKKKGLSACFGQSFSEVLDYVSDGRADGCILPVENGRDGVLTGVWKSICENDLFISQICVKNDSSGADAKFALLCRGFSDIIEADEHMRLYLRLVYDTSFHTLLPVLSVLRVKLLGTFSIPLLYTDGFAQICSFSGSQAALFALLLWLRLMKADATVLGICAEEED